MVELIVVAIGHGKGVHQHFNNKIYLFTRKKQFFLYNFHLHFGELKPGHELQTGYDTIRYIVVQHSWSMRIEPEHFLRKQFVVITGSVRSAGLLTLKNMDGIVWPCRFLRLIAIVCGFYLNSISSIAYLQTVFSCRPSQQQQQKYGYGKWVRGNQSVVYSLIA